jgi:hypothetical protein
VHASLETLTKAMSLDPKEDNLIVLIQAQIRASEIERDQKEKAKEELKVVIKEAIKEWLNEKFQAFGRWSLTGLAAAVLTAMIWLILKSKGFEVGK